MNSDFSKRYLFYCLKKSNVFVCIKFFLMGGVIVGKLALFAVAPMYTAKVTEWYSNSQKKGLWVYATLGAVDLACFSFSEQADEGLNTLFEELQLKPGFEGSTPGGWARGYICDFEIQNNKHYSTSRESFSNGALILIRHSETQKCPISLIQNLKMRNIFFKTSGFYQVGAILECTFDKAYNLFVKPLRQRGFLTYSIPVICLQTLLGKDTNINIPATIRLSASVRPSVNGDREATKVLRQLLKNSCSLDRKKNTKTSKLEFTHGVRDIILKNPVEIDLIKYKRNLWHLKKEPSWPFTSTRTLLSVPLTLSREKCVSTTQQIEEPKDPDPQDPRSPYTGMVASPFALIDRAGGVDFSKKMFILREWLRKLQELDLIKNLNVPQLDVFPQRP